MASRWIDVELVQSEAIDLGLDTSGRQLFGMNIFVRKEPSTVFAAEIRTVLLSGGISSSQIFISSKAQIPVGDGPFIQIRTTGGPTGIRTHNVISGPTYRQSTAHLVSMAKTTPAALALIETAMTALAAVKNQTVA